MAKRIEKIKEFKRLPEKELKSLLVEKKEALRRMRFDLAAGKVKNVREIRETRRDIARIGTLICEAEAKAGGAVIRFT